MSIINQPNDDGTTTPPTPVSDAASSDTISEAARETARAVAAPVIQRAVAEATATIRHKLDAFLLDWAETDTAVREAALRVLTPFEVNGDTHGVPCVTDIVDVLVKRAEACKRDGNWFDKWGACKVCGGEIPHGHTANCDIYKLECEVRLAKEATAPLVAALIVETQNHLPACGCAACVALAAHARKHGGAP